MVVVLELGKRQQFLPVILSLIDKQLKILLEFLVDMFGLPITLRVVGSGCQELDSKESVELMGEFSNKLGSSVGHDMLWEAMQLPYVSEV